MADTPKSTSTDGRHRRAERSRTRIVDALLALVDAGNPNPNAEEVAATAKVGIRSVFRHFKDMESLYREMSLRLESEYLLAAKLNFASPDWRGRIIEMIDRRFEVFERLAPYRRAVNGYCARWPTVQTDIERMSSFLRMRLHMVVPADAVSTEQFEALDAVLSFEGWNRLRQNQLLSPEATRRVVDLLVAKLLD